METVKKLSVASVVGKVKVDKGEKKRLMRVIGVAMGTKKGTSQFGDWIALEGTFKATNIETGAVVMASVCLLPDVALLQIVAAMDAANGNPVEFAVDVIATGDAEPRPGGLGYSYSAEWLMESGADDPLKAIEARILALPAPSTSEAPQTKKGK